MLCLPLLWQHKEHARKDMAGVKEEERFSVSHHHNRAKSAAGKLRFTAATPQSFHMTKKHTDVTLLIIKGGLSPSSSYIYVDQFSALLSDHMLPPAYNKFVSGCLQRERGGGRGRAGRTSWESGRIMNSRLLKWHRENCLAKRKHSIHSWILDAFHRLFCFLFFQMKCLPEVNLEQMSFCTGNLY